jgi:hypothetical protein
MTTITADTYQPITINVKAPSASSPPSPPSSSSSSQQVPPSQSWAVLGPGVVGVAAASGVIGYVVSLFSYMAAVAHDVGRSASDRQEEWRDRESEFEA